MWVVTEDKKVVNLDQFDMLYMKEGKLIAARIVRSGKGWAWLEQPLASGNLAQRMFEKIMSNTKARGELK